MPTPKPARSAAPNPMPIQYTPLTLKHFQTPEGVAFINLQLSQIVNALNRGTGQGGPVVIPAGVDVAGANVTGLGTPTDPSDAVNLGHAQGNYGAPAVGPNLDIGGKNTLKGLAYVYSQLPVPIATAMSLGIVQPDGTTITITSKGVISAVGGGSSPNFSDNESPSGSGMSWTLAHAPSPAESLLLFSWLTGFGAVLLVQGEDYTLSGDAITITAMYTIGSLYAFYRY